jgi:CrcB protein
MFGANRPLFPMRRLLTTPLIAVAAGGLLGSSTRVLITQLVGTPQSGWPVATLAVNLVGAFVLAGYLARREGAVAAPLSLELWAIGALGSFTTFSAFSLEVVLLIDAGRAAAAVGYAAASTIGGMAVAIAGAAAGSRRT